jgi:hypothetical protein
VYLCETWPVFSSLSFSCMQISHAAGSPDRQPPHGAKLYARPLYDGSHGTHGALSPFHPNGHCISMSFEVDTERAGRALCMLCLAVFHCSHIRRRGPEHRWWKELKPPPIMTDDPGVWIANGRQLQLSQQRAPACNGVDLRLGCPLSVATFLLPPRRSSFLSS